MFIQEGKFKISVFFDLNKSISRKQLNNFLYLNSKHFFRIQASCVYFSFNGWK